MMLQDDEAMLNKSTITKFGIEHGQVFIYFHRRGTTTSELPERSPEADARRAAE
jgi:hypothetical protein